MTISAELRALLTATIFENIGPCQVMDIVKRPAIEQGMSGNEVNEYAVTYRQRGVQRTEILVTKTMARRERLPLMMLAEQGCPVPFACSAVDEDEPSGLVAMQRLAERVPMDKQAADVADALADVHVANLNMGRVPEWMSRGDKAYFHSHIVDDCWRKNWHSLLNEGEFVDGYGNSHGLPKPGGDFSAEFNHLTDKIEQVASRYLARMDALLDEADTLTLIHGDLHKDHIMTDGQQVRLIDWGQSRYGSFYLDLPNLFTADNVHLYRDALAARGVVIATDQFMLNFEAVQAHIFFKYCGIGLWNWCFGDPPHQASYVEHFLQMIL